MTHVEPTFFKATIHGPRRYVTESDKLLFFGEYVSGAGFAGETNNLISNLKKPPDSREELLRYKRQAVATCAKLLATTFKGAEGLTWVPVPSSYAMGDPLHDARLMEVLRQAVLDDVRELVVASTSIRPAHKSPGNRPTPSQLAQTWMIDESLASPPPHGFAVFDDVLTEGAHYRAMEAMLAKRFPGTPCLGVFIALCTWR